MILFCIFFLLFFFLGGGGVGKQCEIKCLLFKLILVHLCVTQFSFCRKVKSTTQPCNNSRHFDRIELEVICITFSCLHQRCIKKWRIRGKGMPALIHKKETRMRLLEAQPSFTSFSEECDVEEKRKHF